MAGTKISALPAGIVPVTADVFPSVQSGASVKVTTSQIRQYIGEGLTGASLSTVGAGYAADTYLAGSAITIPTAGGWRVGTMLRWSFDMVKTAAGVAGPTITVRMGTLGTISDASVYVFTYGGGSAVTDQGWFAIDLIFRSVGAGTAAVVAGASRLIHTAAGGTGLTNTGAGPVALLLPGASAGFNSTTQTIIGLSFNGGASFSGTNTLVTADADNI